MKTRALDSKLEEIIMKVTTLPITKSNDISVYRMKVEDVRKEENLAVFYRSPMV